MFIITYTPRLSRTIKVERISNVFRSLYNYEVRDVALASELHNTDVWWTSDESSVELEDLQIVYYLGSTTQNGEGEFLNIRASPFCESM